MRTVLWREYRLNQFILLIGAVLMLTPFLVTGIAWFWEEYEPHYTIAMATSDGAFFGLAVVQIALAALGGTAFVRERQERSDEYMA